MNELSYPQPSVPTPPIPMTFGQILDRTYRLMRAHLRLFLGIAAVPAATILVFISVWMTLIFKIAGPQLTGKTPGIGAVAGGVPLLFSTVIFVCYPLILLIYALYLPAAAFAATQADRGVMVSFRQAYNLAWSCFGRSLWLMVLCILYVVVPVALIAALIGTGVALIHHAAGLGSGQAFAFFLIPLLVLLYLAILVYSVWIMLRFAVAYPACVEENLTAWASLQRSSSLTRGGKGRIFLVMLVVYAVVYAAELACILVLLILAAVAALIAMSAHVTVGSPPFFMLVGLGVLAYMLVIAATVLISYAAFTTSQAVIYHDQRLRKDGRAPQTGLA
jgi:hypothetical protein